MKTNKILPLVVTALTITSMLAGCKKNNNNSNQSSSNSESESESSSSSQGEEILLSAVDQKEEFVHFLANRSKPATQADGFFDNTQEYTVGDDNPFNVKPELTVLDAKTYTPVPSSRWTYDFDISATMDGGSEKVGETYFSVVDAKEADIQFTSQAVGHTFTISVTPTHIDEASVTKFTKSFTVKVVDGYNIYNAKELGYLDTRTDNDNTGEESAAINAGYVNKWNDFLSSNGFKPNNNPAAVLMHTDLKVTASDIPSTFIYTKAEATARSDVDAEGSLKDRTYMYRRTTEGSVTLNGNYFGLDVSELPLITRENDEPTAKGAVVAHSALFKVDNGEMDFLNLNITGNAPRAVKDEDTIYGGGLIFAKGGSRATRVDLKNLIARDLYITVMTEKPEEGCPVLSLNFEKAKCSNNYNSFIYSWGGIVDAVSSSFSNCGGPVIIQDHKAPGDDNYDSNNGMLVNGYAPVTNFINCEINNYVAGTEAWFQQFGVTALVGQIKAMSDLYYAAGLGKGYVVDESHNAAVYQVLAAQSKASFFNFVAINKSSTTEGATAKNVCGIVNIVKDDKQDYLNYRQPNEDPVAKAYLAYQADPSDANQTALIMAAMAKGVEFAPDFSDANEKITAYLTALCTPHEIIRGLNNNGAPVFDLGHDLPLGTTDGATPTMLDATVFAGSSGAIKQQITLSDEQKAAIGDYTSVYYNGMALVFALYSF